MKWGAIWAAVALLAAGCNETKAGHPIYHPRMLSHKAVEAYIMGSFGFFEVHCNEGHNIVMTHAGQTFMCYAAGHPFRVRIQDPRTGSYIVGIGH